MPFGSGDAHTDAVRGYMKISYVSDGSSDPSPVISGDGDSWFRISDIVPEIPLTSIIDILTYEKSTPGLLSQRLESPPQPAVPVEMSTARPVLPFQPRAYCDFMLYEQHAIDAARGFVHKYLPKLRPVVSAYEKVFGKTFPNSNRTSGGIDTRFTTSETI
jgi:hypothetical protein